MSTVAIIPARGGSKGIRYKNIVSFLGNPLLSYTVVQSLASSSIDHTFVSTDDEKIAAAGADAGAEIIDRPDHLAGDEATTESALLHALSDVRGRGIDPDLVVLLQCTSPLRRDHDIEDTVNLVADGRYDSALSVCEDHSFYWERGGESATPVNYAPTTRKRRQDMEDRFRENGSIYVMRSSILEAKECRLGGDIGLHEMPVSHSFEIDDHDDLRTVAALGRSVEFYTSDLEVTYDRPIDTDIGN